MNLEPIKIIAAIRIGIKNSETRFQKGGCFQLFLILKELYSDAEAWYDGSHVYTKIGDAFYDINGVHNLPKDAYKLVYEPMIYAKAHEWDFK
jgi:hypothetical protein